MRKTKFTPGPWRALPEEADKDYIRVRGPFGRRHKIANVLLPVYEGVHEREAEETRANANLIAAAPDMFAALEVVVEQWTSQWENKGTLAPAWCKQARAALAKARGEEAQ